MSNPTERIPAIPAAPDALPPAVQEFYAARSAAASAGVRALAEKYGAQFLDLNAGITDANGSLKAEYTVEGMHMYADGYKPVLDALLPALTAAAKAAGLLPD